MSFILTSKTRGKSLGHPRRLATSGLALKAERLVETSGRAVPYEHVTNAALSFAGNAYRAQGRWNNGVIKTTSAGHVQMPAVSFASRQSVTALVFTTPQKSSRSWDGFLFLRGSGSNIWGLSYNGSESNLSSAAAGAGQSTGTVAAIKQGELSLLAATFVWSGSLWKQDRFVIDSSGVKTGTESHASSTTDWVASSVWEIGHDNFSTRDSYGEYHLAGLFNGEMSIGEMREIYENPRGLFDTAPHRTYFMPGAGGGPSTYNETIAETFSFVDAPTRTAVFARTLAEALTLIDSTTGSAGGIFNETIAETLSLVDAATRTGVYNRLIAESLALIDAASSEGGSEIAVSTKGGQSMTLRQMRRLEREQLLAMIRDDDDIVVALVSQLLAKGRRLN